jgi:Na+-transporting NADH:ubiquinone oxidoreductase subunit A
MRLRGGYDIRLSGRPSGEVETLPEPDELLLPLRSRRFSFDAVKVKEGERVHPGHVLAEDPKSFSVPLLAPRAGTVRLPRAGGHVKLVDLAKESEEPFHPDEEAEHAARGMSSAGMKRYQLLGLGAWQFVSDAHTGAPCDPFGAPRAAIVSTVHREPHVARGDVQLRKRLRHFMRGLEHLQGLLEYQPIYLVMPDVGSAFAREVRERLRGYAWVKLVEIPLKYPFDHPAVIARSLGFSKDPRSPVWSLGTEGVLAVDRALTLSRPATVRIVSIGGPAVERPVHLKAMPGYPLEAIVGPRVRAGRNRVLSGGALTGRGLGPDALGLDSECEGLTVLRDGVERELLGFMRPGLSRRSYSRCFLGSLRAPFREPLTTALRGEPRPCVSCGFCEEVCPARIMPHLIHKYLYQGAVEEAERARVDLCVECGLCSFVCPSKIELMQQFIEAKRTIGSELAEVAAGGAA